MRPLSEKQRWRTSFDSQHVNVSQTLVKSAWARFYHIFSTLWRQTTSQISPWVQYGFLELLTYWLPMTIILFGIARIWRSLFTRNYLKNEKLFLSCLFHFWILQLILNIFKKRNSVIANVCPILQTVKDLVRPISKKHCFRTSFDSQLVKGSQTLLKSVREHFYHIFSSLWGKINWEINLLLICQILGVFFDTLAADGKCPPQDIEI